MSCSVFPSPNLLELEGTRGNCGQQVTKEYSFGPTLPSIGWSPSVLGNQLVPMWPHRKRRWYGQLLIL